MAAVALFATTPVVGLASPSLAEEPEPTVVTVTNANAAEQGWEIESDAIGEGGGIGFAAAPGDDLENHPAPPGNLVLETHEPQVAGGMHRITTTDDSVVGTKLEDVTLDYWTLVTELPDGSEVAPYLMLQVIPTQPATGGPAPVPTTLIFEPRFNGATGSDIWQSWIATADDAVWWTVPPSMADPATLLCSPGDEDPGNNLQRCNWNEITFAHGDAEVASVAIGVGDPLRSGSEDWANVEAHADALLVGTDDGEIIYDFELATTAARGHDVFGLSPGTNEIWRFDMENVTTDPAAVAVSGLGPDETLVGIDFRPGTGIRPGTAALFGVTIDGDGLGRVYDLGDPSDLSVEATLVTPAPFRLPGDSFGVSFDPQPATAGHHLLHVVGDEEVHLAVDVGSGAVTPQSPLAYDPSGTDGSVDPAVSALAHAPGPVGVDVRVPGPAHLVTLASPAGFLASRGALNGFSTDKRAGLDTAANGMVFGAFSSSTLLGGEVARLRRFVHDDTDDITAETSHLALMGQPLDDIALPPTGYVGFETSDDTASAGTSTITVHVERAEGSYGALTVDVVDITAGDGSAEADDYELKTPQLHFSDGSTQTQPVEIEITRPAGEPGNVDVVLQLADPAERATNSKSLGNYIGGDRTFTLTIEGQTAAEITFDAAPAAIGEGGTRTLVVKRVGGDTPNVSAVIRPKLNGAVDEATPDEDYTGIPPGGVLVEFPDDVAPPDKVNVSVNVINDTDAEGPERARFELVEPSTGAVIVAPSEVELTINDDSPGAVAFEPDEYEVDEGDSVTVFVERSEGNEGATEIQVADTYTGVDEPENRAVPGEDYEVFATQAHTFPGVNDSVVRQHGFVVTTLPTASFDGSRFVEFELTKLSGSADVGTATATVTIRDLTQGNAFLVTDDGKLASFDPADPSNVSTPVTVEDAEQNPIDLVGIDFRPNEVDPGLYGVAIGGTTVVYEIDPVAGNATLMPTAEIDVLGVPLPYPAAPALLGDDFGVDFDATDDTLRVVSDLGEHLIFDASTWQWRPGTPFIYGAGDVAGDGPDSGLATVPAVVAVAHDQNVAPLLLSPEPPASTAYGIDAEGDAVVRIGSPGGDPIPAEVGVMETIIDELPDTDGSAGLDIGTDGGAYAVLTDATTGTNLYDVDLVAGVVTDRGPIANGPYIDIALAPSGVLRFAETNSDTITGEGQTVEFKVERAGGTAGEVTVDFSAVSGTADVPGDVTLTPGTLTFPDGASSSQPFMVTVVDDEGYEGDETFGLALANVTGGAVLVTPSETVTVVDDPVGTLEFVGAPYGIDEDAGPAVVSVRRAGGGEGVLTVDVATQQRATGNIAVAGDDYDAIPTPSALTFAHGEVDEVQATAVTLASDNEEERDEVLNVRLSNPSVGVALPTPLTTQLAILNDDHAGSVKLSAATYEVSEDAGSLVVTFQRTPSGQADGTVAVDFSTSSAGHTAAAGTDYTAVTDRRVSFGDGETTKTVTVPITDDADLEGDETFQVAIDDETTEFEWRSVLASPTSAIATIRDAEPGALLAVVADSDDDGAQELVEFDTARPDEVVPIAPISGLNAGQEIVAIDRRPGNGEYYALGVGADDGTLYRLDISDGSLTSLGELVDGSGNRFPVAAIASMAVDPVRDVARVVDALGQNLRVEFPAAASTTLTVIEDNPVWYGNGDVPGIVGVAFTDVVGGGATQYDVDAAHDQLARQGDDGDTASADDGRLAAVGSFSVDAGAGAGFDIDEHGRAVVALSSSPSALYQVDQATGAEHHIGDIGDGLMVDALAAAPSSGTLGFESATLEAVDEDDEPDRTEDVTVARTGGTGDVAFSYRVLDAAGNDVTPVDNTGAFTGDEDATTITVPVPGDNVYRDDTALTLQIYDVTGAELGVAETELPVTDDDEPTVSITPATASHLEGDTGTSDVSFTLQLSNPTAKATEVAVSTEGGTATAGEDYAALVSEVVTIEANVDAAPSTPIQVAVTADTTDEDHETFAVTLASPKSATVDDGEATVTITDDDAPPTISVGPLSVPEGNVGTTTAVVPVTLSAASGKTVTVHAATSDGTAEAPIDYLETTADIEFAPGETTKPFEVPVIGDVLDEFDETFRMALSGLVNADAGTLSADVTIVDDDEPPVMSIGDARIVEGDTGSTEMVFDVQLSGPSAKTIMITGTTADDTATAGQDYVSARGRGIFVPGVTSLPARAQVIGDTVDEPDETFRIVLSDPVNVRIGDGTGAGTIVDDDEPEVRGVTVSSSYRVVDADGNVYVFDGSGQGRLESKIPTSASVAGVASTPSGQGSWVLDAAGGIFTVGDAEFFGSVPELKQKGVPIGDARTIDVSATPTGRGYSVLDSKGGIFTFGDAPFVGSVPGLRNAGVSIGDAPIVDVAATPSGKGYWVLDLHGGIFAFGDAQFFGSIPGLRADDQSIGSARVAAMAPTPTGNGYWIVDTDGGIFTFGDAKFFGSIPSLRGSGHDVGLSTVLAITPTATGRGYFLVDVAGGVFTFGDARFAGSLPGIGVSTRAVGISAR